MKTTPSASESTWIFMALYKFYFWFFDFERINIFHSTQQYNTSSLYNEGRAHRRIIPLLILDLRTRWQKKLITRRHYKLFYFPRSTTASLWLKWRFFYCRFS